MTRLYSTLFISIFFSLLDTVTVFSQTNHFCQQITVSLSDDGEATVDASAFAIPFENCCPAELNEYEISTNTNFEPTITFTCDDLGLSMIRVRSIDCLGNNHTCETSVIVQDNIDVCYGNCPNCCYPVVLARPIGVALSEENEVTIFASQFNAGSFSPCTGELLALSFSADPNDTVRVLGCNEIGLNAFQLWATDASGVANFGVVQLVALDNGELCDTPGCLPIPRIIPGLQIELPSYGSEVCVDASEFDIASELPSCSSASSFTFSFSQDPTETQRCFGCNQLGVFSHTIYVIDDEGNYNSVFVSILVTASIGQCYSPSLIANNDGACDAIAVDDLFGATCNIPFFNFGATAPADEIAPTTGGCTTQNTWCDSGAEGSVWFSFTAPDAETVTISTEGMNTQLALWEVDDCDGIFDGSALLVAANDDDPNGTNGSSLLTANCLAVGQTYFLQVDGFEGAEGGFFLMLSAEGSACVTNESPVFLACGTSNLNLVQSTGAGEWLHFLNEDEKIIASINDRQQALGEVSADFMINAGDVRTDAQGVHYLDRNWIITPAQQPQEEVLVRLYFTEAEYAALENASPLVAATDDLTSTKVSDGECGNYGAAGVLVDPENIFTFNENTIAVDLAINDFSAFYVHGPTELTRTDDEAPVRSFKVFPNPVAQQLDLNLPLHTFSQSHLRLMDVKGKLLMEKDNFTETTLNVGHLPNGIYLIKIKTKEGIWVSRFSKISNPD
ncbi:MAG: T9SS type A sorting domain-containing protein [Bacteroidota bacterium]